MATFVLIHADTVIAATGERSSSSSPIPSAGSRPPLVCDGVSAMLLVLVAGMIPRPGEPPDDLWSNTRSAGEMGHEGEGADVIATFSHDVPPDLVAEALERERAHPSTRATREPWPLAASGGLADRLVHHLASTHP